jgi:hypothetical protein
MRSEEIKDAALEFIRELVYNINSKPAGNEKEILKAKLFVITELISEYNKISYEMTKAIDINRNTIRIKAISDALKGMIREEDIIGNEVKVISKDGTSCCGHCCSDKKEEENEYTDVITCLAAIEHAHWSEMMNEVLNNITPDNISKWRGLANTPYTSLAIQDREKAKVWAEKIADIL